MAAEPEVRVLCSYCEGVRDGRAFLKALDRLAGVKPLLVWKVGGTAAGRQAAASHTGALSGQETIWRAVFRRFGVLEVSDVEEMLDTLTAFYHLPWTGGGRIALVSGPGGPLVSAADALERNGLLLAPLGPGTQERLRKILPATGTSWRNPVDVGLAASFDLDQYLDTLEVLGQDTGVDAIVVLGGGLSQEMNERYVQGLIRIRQNSGKALLAVAFPGFLTDPAVLEPLHASGIPVYPTPERALRSYARLKVFAGRLRHAPSPPAAGR
jgi:acetyltransferase